MAIFFEKYNPNWIITSNDNLPSQGSGILVAQPSILALKNVKGNDPTGIDLFGGIIKYYRTDPALKKLTNWQWNYSVPLPYDLQNIIWLVY